jgi:dihydrofolate reductase
MNGQRKVVLFIAMSLDGYIADAKGDIGFLSAVEQPGEDYGYGEFIQTVDTVVLGRKTYDKVLGFGIPFPHADKQTYVITRTPGPSKDRIHFYTGNPGDLIRQLKEESGKNIFVDGGAEIVNALLKENLIDEFIISIIPVLLGDGVALFNPNRPGAGLKHVNTRSFGKGLVQLHYTRIAV